MGRESKATIVPLADRVQELERVVGLLALFHNSLVGHQHGGVGTFWRRLIFLLKGR